MKHLRGELPDKYEKPISKLLKELNENSEARIYKNNLVKILLDAEFKRRGINVK